MDQIVACLSPNGTRETSAQGPATRLLVASLKGVARFERTEAGAPWRLADQTLVECHVGALLYEPRSGKLFAGAHKDGGLWVSDDGAGASWRRVSTGLDRPHIYALAAQSRGDRVVLYAGTEPVGLYRSDDLGESWRELPAIRTVRDIDKWTFPPPPHIAHVKDIAFYPGALNTLYVCIEQGALLKTTDGGESWFELSDYSKVDDHAYRDTHRILIHPSNPRMLYMASGEGLYGSSDAGVHWTHLTTPRDRIGYPDFLFFDPDDSGTLFMGGAAQSPSHWRHQPSGSTVARSTDSGRTWTVLDTGLPQLAIGSFEAMGLHAWPGGMMLTVGTATGEVYISENRGAAWTKIAEGLAPISKDGHYRMFLPRDAQEAGGRAHT